jgi:undecaprenyl diphosphate synthase
MSPAAETNPLNHLAISPDGNRRWATGHGMAKADGYDAGLENLPGILDVVASEGIPYLSLHVMNTLSWDRPAAEMDRVMTVVTRFVDSLSDMPGVRVAWVGHRYNVPTDLYRRIAALENREVPSSTLTVVLYFDYDYADHLAAADGRLDQLEPVGVPPVDLYIRTSDDQRTSGFDPLRVAYAELAFVPGGFPEFTGHRLREVIAAFHGRTLTHGV